MSSDELSWHAKGSLMSQKLEPWELTRVTKLIQDEIDSRHRAPGRKGRPIGPRSDIDAFEKALKILRLAVVEL